MKRSFKGDWKMKSLRMLIIAAVIAALAVPAMAQVQLAAGSCPVNLKVMPTATIIAPQAINVAISTITGTGPILGSSSGQDYGTFLIGTNLSIVQISATIGSPGLTGGIWACHLQGLPAWGTTSTNNYPGPIPAGTPFNVFVQVQNVDMTSVVFNNAFVYDTTLTLTLSIP